MKYTDGLQPIEIDGEEGGTRQNEVRDWQKTTDGVKGMVDLLTSKLDTYDADYSVEWETVGHLPHPPPAKILGGGCIPPMDVVKDVLIRIPVHHWMRDQIDPAKRRDYNT